MRILLQRVKEASVDVSGRSTGQAGMGLLALVGFRDGDQEAMLVPMVEKMVQLRIFEDEDGKMNRSVLEVGGDLVVVPQFTLYANTRKGRRPSFVQALEPGRAAQLFRQLVEICAARVNTVYRGEFGAEMQIHLINDGPVTILLDSGELGVDGRMQQNPETGQGV